ncbi:MAG: carboxypeptidase regulatory-like domain-containing protein, partial [Abditibacteriota bacterium]|nr:carboxypeptidase regulatory-like domain-containing protein [Abditibacteriota bacterium]
MKKLFSVLLLLALAGAVSASGIKVDSAGKTALIENGRIRITVDFSSKLNATGLTDLKTGKVYADSHYVWGMGEAVVAGAPKAAKNSVTFKAEIGDVTVTQVFAVPKEKDVITETITIANPTDKVIDTSAFRCGFTHKIGAGSDDRVCDVPFRRHSETGDYNDFALRDFFGKENTFSAMRSPIYDRRKTDQWGAEGWARYDGGNVLLVSKYNPTSMEWSLIQPLTVGDDKYIRFGGAGTWKLGDPDGALSLDPGESFTFGETRYKIMDGDWKTAYYDYRSYLNTKGVVIGTNYNPPVHWNELYDNPLLTVMGDSLENRAKYYRREDMAIELAKAEEMGCEAFYMDPGWDDKGFGSFLWAEDRLGDLTDFVDWMGKTYGIHKLALHTPIAPWCDANQFPEDARVMNEDGTRQPIVCVASKQYRKEISERLSLLAHKGAYYYLFDGSWYEHICYDPNHGHGVPKTRQDHIDGILANIRATKALAPEVMIEQHDMITGPGTPRYTPMYLFYGIKNGIEELWAHEYMNEPLDDVLSRRAAALYYNDMGVDTPIYLHIDLRQDNRNTTALWWYYSTCRHMGMGGKSADPVIWNAQKNATKLYKANKDFYTRGVFYGIDETCHGHTLPEPEKTVLNIFNLDDKAANMTFTFTFADIGLKPGLLDVEGADAAVAGNNITVTAKNVPSVGNAFVKLHRVNPKKAAKVTGKVTLSATGEPLPGAVVTIGGYGTTTAFDGSYSLYVPAGTHTASAEIGGVSSDPVSLVVKKGGAAADFVVKGSVIEGKVVNTMGMPVANAVVSDPKAGLNAVTDETGDYRLILPAGGYNLTAASFGSGVSEKKARVGEGKSARCDFEIDALLGVWNVSKDFHNKPDSDSPWQY